MDTSDYQPVFYLDELLRRYGLIVTPQSFTTQSPLSLSPPFLKNLDNQNSAKGWAYKLAAAAELHSFQMRTCIQTSLIHDLPPLT